MGYQNENGILRKSGFEKGNARFAYQWNGKNGQFNIKLSAAIYQRDSKLSKPHAFWRALIFNPTLPIFLSDGRYSALKDGNIFYENPISLLENENNLARTRDWSLNLRAIKYISSKKKVESQISFRQRNHFFGFEQHYFPNYDLISFSSYGRKQILGKLQGTKQFNWKQLKITRVTGIETTLTFDKNNSFNVRATDEEVFDFHTIEEPATKWENTNEEVGKKDSKNSFATWVGTTFDWNILRLDAGLRYDKANFDDVYASKFFYFTRVDANFTSLINNKWINQTRLSLGYGKTGSLTTPSFLTNPQIQNIFAGEFLLPREDDTGVTNETKTEINLQLSLSLFEYRLKGVFNFYNNLLNNQIVIPNEVSNGEIGNRGMEAYLEYKIVNKKRLNWRAGLSLFTNKTLIYRYNKSNEPALLSSFDREFRIYNEMWLEPYGLAGQIYGYKTAQKLSNGLYMPLDIDGDNNADLLVIGNSKPSYAISFTNNLVLGKWDFSVKFRSILGHDLSNFFRETNEIIDNSRFNSIKTRYFNDERKYRSTEDLDVFVENASFLKMDFLSIGFNPTLKNGQLRIYAAGHDLLTITGYTGIDPEPRYQYRGNSLSGGFESEQPYFRSRQVVIGAQLTL